MIMYDAAKYLLLSCLMTINILPWSSYAQVENTTQTLVTISQGTLQGKTLTTRNGRDISAFLKIPYAQPPIGKLRFANPVEADDWIGTRDASVDTDRCPQISGTEIVGNEDCLYINVYTPQLSEGTNASLIPVMVYIHGGRFARGSPESTNFGPGYLLDEDIVLVVPGYRIGPLGFLSTGDEVASGNWGLKDMTMALRWVQRNVKDFGGDPDRVTIFGQSSGGTSVHLLTLSDSTIGLFHRYVTQSGSALAKWAHSPRAAYAQRAFDLGSYVGCPHDTSDALIDCLRTVDCSDIIATHPKFLVWESQPGIVWTPTDEPDIAGAFLTDSPTNLFAAGKIRDLPWITGNVRDEGLINTAEYYTNAAMFEDLLDKLDTILPEMLSFTYETDSGAAWVKAIRSYYFNDDLTTDRSLLLANLTILISDVLFFYPAHKAIRQQSALAGNPQYFYTFNYRGNYSKSTGYGGGSTDYGVSHGDDVIYLFPPQSSSESVAESLSQTDSEMVDSMVQLWTSFATDGVPKSTTFDGNTTWEAYNSTMDNYLRIGNESDAALELQYSFHEKRMQFWAALESDSVTFHPNLFFVLLLPCLTFLLLAKPVDMLV